MPAPKDPLRRDGFVRGHHPDQRKGLRPSVGGKSCAHEPQNREVAFNSNGDLLVHCVLCDRSWWEYAT